MKYPLILGVFLYFIFFYSFTEKKSVSEKISKFQVPQNYTSFSKDKNLVFKGELPENNSDWIFAFWIKLDKTFLSSQRKLIFSNFNDQAGIGLGIDSDSVSSFPEIAWYNNTITKKTYSDTKIEIGKWYYFCLHYSSNDKLSLGMLDEVGVFSLLGSYSTPEIPKTTDEFIFPGRNSDFTGLIADPIILKGKLKKSWIVNCQNSSQHKIDKSLSIMQ